MILISHRGNIDGKNIELENQPLYIDKAISLGYNVEIDVWYNDNQLWLGHDSADYQIDINWLKNKLSKLWIHCKNISAIEYFHNSTDVMIRGYANYFFHNIDDTTITSKGYLWVYPGKQSVKNSIAVMPEIHNDDISNCIGICSDEIIKFKNVT
jgi:hypothetical protein